MVSTNFPNLRFIGTAGGGYRFLQGQTLHLRAMNSGSGVRVLGWARVIYDDGSDALLSVPERTLSAEIVEEDFISTDIATHDGWVVAAAVEMLTSDIKRGQTYVRLRFEPLGSVLLQDYCFSFSPVLLGTFVQTGPGGGAGHLELVTVKANGAPVATTILALALSNAIRKIHSFIWYYACSSDVANRILALRIYQPLGALPTGYTAIPDSYVWVATGLTLTADEDGAMFLDEKRSGTNDNGVLVIDDASSAPSPLPLLLDGDDNSLLILSTAAGEALDFNAAYLLQETWVVL